MWANSHQSGMHGIDAVEVPAPYTSCRKYGRTDKKSHMDRDTLICVYCTSIFHADANAAWNIPYGGESRHKASEEPYGDKPKPCDFHGGAGKRQECLFVQYNSPSTRHQPPVLMQADH